MPKLTSFSVLSFDVYGTLIDWETGILTALEPLLGPATHHTRADLIPLFHRLESAQQTATPAMPYNDVLAAVHAQMAERLGLPPPSPEANAAFGGSVGRWPAFADTVSALQRLGRRFRLVVLSNVDRGSFERCVGPGGALAGIEFDAVLTAQEIGSYKPDVRNFEYLLRYVRESWGVEREQVLQTAQSQFHDHEPAQKAGIRSAWIARANAAMGDREGAVFDWKFATLGEMADAVEKEDVDGGQ